jgi:hypothetical protein
VINPAIHSGHQDFFFQLQVFNSERLLAFALNKQADNKKIDYGPSHS